VATTADPHLAPSTLISHADAAMYRAKRSGRGRVAVFDAAEQAAEHAAAGTRDQLARELASAVAHAQLELHYQPILDLRTGATRAVEALLRWRHPTRGLLTAAQFIEQAESSRLILDLSGWVVDTACRQLAAWDAALGERAPGSVCVNLSTLELGQPSLDRAVGDALDRWQIPPDRLTLEITETGLMDEPGAAAAVLQRLRDRGCRIAIDDFGTGYSSLSRVVEVPADMIKVDRTFTSQLSSGGPASAVVSAVLHIADRLGRTVVVEGVEDDAAARTLLDLGVSYGQGFHLAVPQSGEDLTRSLSG
jgi:EAL domain-containing protein (putative c-di-GMP-specific phosphodiesterase class I)